MRATFEDLGAYRAIVKEIEDLETRKATEGQPHAIRYDAVLVQTSPDGSGVETAAERREELQLKIDSRLRENRLRAIAIREYIEAVPDAEARTFLRRRYIDGATLTQIARENHQSRHTISRKIYRAVKRNW